MRHASTRCLSPSMSWRPWLRRSPGRQGVNVPHRVVNVHHRDQSRSHGGGRWDRCVPRWRTWWWRGPAVDLTHRAPWKKVPDVSPTSFLWRNSFGIFLGVSLGKFGGIFSGYVGKIIEPWKMVPAGKHRHSHHQLRHENDLKNSSTFRELNAQHVQNSGV